MSAAGTPQLRVQLGTVEVTDTERRAVAWHIDGAMLTSGTLADRDTLRAFLRAGGQNRLDTVVSHYLNAGGQTASMEARAAARAARHAGGEQR